MFGVRYLRESVVTDVLSTNSSYLRPNLRDLFISIVRSVSAIQCRKDIFGKTRCQINLGCTRHVYILPFCRFSATTLRPLCPTFMVQRIIKSARFAIRTKWEDFVRMGHINDAVLSPHRFQDNVPYILRIPDYYKGSASFP